jgi:transcriptional regulator with XRE-family HTH domain
MTAPVGTILANGRRKAGVKAEDLVKQLGTERTYLSKVENNRVIPSIDFILRAAKCCNMDITKEEAEKLHTEAITGRENLSTMERKIIETIRQRNWSKVNVLIGRIASHA